MLRSITTLESNKVVGPRIADSSADNDFGQQRSGYANGSIIQQQIQTYQTNIDVKPKQELANPLTRINSSMPSTIQPTSSTTDAARRERHIKLLMSQTNASRAQASTALTQASGDIADAIMKIFDSTEMQMSPLQSSNHKISPIQGPYTHSTRKSPLLFPSSVPRQTYEFDSSFPSSYAMSSNLHYGFSSPKYHSNVDTIKSSGFNASKSLKLSSPRNSLPTKVNK